MRSPEFPIPTAERTASCPLAIPKRRRSGRRGYQSSSLPPSSPPILTRDQDARGLKQVVSYCDDVLALGEHDNRKVSPCTLAFMSNMQKQAKKLPRPEGKMSDVERQRNYDDVQTKIAFVRACWRKKDVLDIQAELLEDYSAHALTVRRVRSYSNEYLEKNLQDAMRDLHFRQSDHRSPAESDTNEDERDSQSIDSVDG